MMLSINSTVFCEVFQGSLPVAYASMGGGEDASMVVLSKYDQNGKIAI